MHAAKVLWGDGQFLHIQYFQQQDRYHENRLHRIRHAIHPLAWGVSEVACDVEALTTNTLRLTALSCLFPDGEIYSAPASDELPAPVNLHNLPPATQTVTFHAGLPIVKTHGENCGADSGGRYIQKNLTTPDLFTTAAAAPVSFLRNTVRLVSDLDSLDSYVSFPLLRLQRRAAGGGFELDQTFLPPSLSVSGAPGLFDRLHKLQDKLQAKVEALYAHHSEPRENVIELRTRDISSFWMMHTTSSGYAALSHFMANPELHPEQLFREMLVLAGGLMTYSKAFKLQALPTYKHVDPGPSFAMLDHMIRELLDTVISSKFIAIALPQIRPSYYLGSLDIEKIDQHTQFYVAVSADMPAIELVALVPQRFKMGAPDDVAACVRSALSALRLVHAPQVPVAVPLRPNTYYFVIENKGTLYEHMLKAKAVSLFVPDVFRDLQVQLIAITS